MNNFILIGKMEQAPKMYETSTGIKYTKLFVTANRPYKNSEGKFDEDRFMITVWKDLAIACVNNLDAGDAVCIKGRVQSNNYEKDGDYHYASEMIGEKVSLLSEMF